MWGPGHLPRQTCPGLLTPRLHLWWLKEGLTCSLAVLPAGPLGKGVWHCCTAVLSGLSGERGGFWSQIQASVGFWLVSCGLGFLGSRLILPRQQN